MSVNLAITLSKMGKKVILLDADFGLANIEIMLGVRPRYNLADLMFKGKEMKDIITYGPENIGFISGGSGINEMANLTKDQVSHLIEKMCELDRITQMWIIVDTGAGIGDAVLEFVARAAFGSAFGGHTGAYRVTNRCLCIIKIIESLFVLSSGQDYSKNDRKPGTGR